MKKIMVTGGCGYIGSHTIVDLIENGFDIISVDNNSRSSEHLLEGIEKITGKKIKNYKVDLCDFNDTSAIFEENEDIAGIIHFEEGSECIIPFVGKIQATFLYPAYEIILCYFVRKIEGFMIWAEHGHLCIFFCNSVS